MNVAQYAAGQVSTRQHAVRQPGSSSGVTHRGEHVRRPKKGELYDILTGDNTRELADPEAVLLPAHVQRLEEARREHE
ncbi:hypothetical protein TRAPUB_3883 [Trametes pubescens]|uniref:Uncharacterized protein n=1 Tax=Trametes pubescens TaxID=154538 RepID=A0A1M2VCP4_TRAPU|nr:hypothetical protein TRAPUB_3883 [Trametes pubescens]